MDRNTTPRRINRPLLWLLVVPLGLLLLLALFGLVDGVLDTDCQVGFFSACGPSMRTLAWVGFLGLPLLIYVYYPIVVIAWVIRRVGRSSTWGP